MTHFTIYSGEETTFDVENNGDGISIGVKRGETVARIFASVQDGITLAMLLMRAAATTGAQPMVTALDGAQPRKRRRRGTGCANSGLTDESGALLCGKRKARVRAHGLCIVCYGRKYRAALKERALKLSPGAQSMVGGQGASGQ